MDCSSTMRWPRGIHNWDGGSDVESGVDCVCCVCVVVDEVTVTVNDEAVTIGRTFADSLGDLVVKVRIGAVKHIVEDAQFADVVLDVETAAGDFTGSDTVKVTGGGRK